jgi:hypothetical protein
MKAEYVVVINGLVRGDVSHKGFNWLLHLTLLNADPNSTQSLNFSTFGSPFNRKIFLTKSN